MRNSPKVYFKSIKHGVPLALIKKLRVLESRKAFCTPTDEKHKVLRSANGVTGYGTASISKFFDKCMWHEGFGIMGSCVEDAKILWPYDYKNFCNTMDAYQNEMKLLTQKLLLLILQTLNVTQEEMNWALSAQDSQTKLQLNSYPSCPNPSNAIGLAPHTDTLLLTLLHQGGANGLEIFVEGLGWSPVNPVDGAFVVNIGDLLHILSNAIFQAVNHRVRVNQAKQRISVAYFHGPPVESVVAPSSSF
ncbi:oxoglutarate/iron-dependent dioxygenase [Artemisia annua]|uniref:Oxoglutarate/iron-dependent dioxygenase n=1 Tax=Artemisia annua TaxID=35608 RepID=A0A2U1PBU4_ARTAN|nr:oxoglutarate/iron-dependent dioxygenase [Artemisia annua]